MYSSLFAASCYNGGVEWQHVIGALFICRFSVEQELNDSETPEACAELFRQTVVQQRINGAVGVEERAARNVYVPVGAQIDDARKPGSVCEKRQHERPDLERQQADVERDDHTHEHVDELSARLQVLLKIVVYQRQTDVR